MPKYEWGEFVIQFQKRYKNKGFTMKKNTGIDTETYQGYVKLICDDFGRSADIENFDDIIKFLTHHRFRKVFNWFYNIRFDFESIVKHLDYSQLVELYSNHELKYNEKYNIKYLDKKFFEISDNNNNVYRFYDLYNFLETSLDKAAQKFLHDEKLQGVDGNKLNTDLNYWKENKEQIVKYCIHDALLTKKLADYFWNLVYDHLNYYPKYPYSKGKLSEEYFLQRCNIPDINGIHDKVIECAYNSYKGGRFELLQRGYFNKIYVYDIKSAYPRGISELIDYSKGEWKRTRQLNEESYSGFYKCKCSSLEPFFSPLIQKVGGLNIYPNGTIEQFLTKKEILFFKENFDNTSVKIDYGYEFYPSELIYPFKTEVERLYHWKEEEKDDDIKYVVKIILNSLYGKTIQVIGGKSGKLFNPMYASEITANTRLTLYKLGLQKPDSIISFSTDSIHTTEKLKTPKNPKLGEFNFEYEGSGIYIMSDIYHLWNDKYTDKKKNKSRMRGFSLTGEKDYESKQLMLKDILKQMKEETEFKYFTQRPYHLGECIMHNKKKTIEQMNIFYAIEKTININGDEKRTWIRNFKSANDAIENNIQSLPLRISD